MVILVILVTAFIIGGEIKHTLSQPEPPKVDIQIIKRDQ